MAVSAFRQASKKTPDIIKLFIGNELVEGHGQVFENRNPATGGNFYY